jgi:hypothetical protein
MIDAAIFMCSLTGNMAQPWAEAGIECFCVDTQHSIRQDRIEGKIHYVWGDVRSYTLPAGYRPIFGAAFTPCTDVAGSGARDFAKKRGYLLRDALEMFEAARQCFEWARIPYMLENSVGVLSNIPHIGKPDYYFHPYDYTDYCLADNYTKKTCIWTGGGFVMPDPARANDLPPPDDRIHKAAPGDDRADFRSATPMGFARAVFGANRPSPPDTAVSP